MLAEESPKKYLSLIIDGMDQAKTNIPRFPEASKVGLEVSFRMGISLIHCPQSIFLWMSLCQQPSFISHKAAESSFLRTHVTGVLSHGDGKAFAFIDKLEWPHDSNLTINILVNVLLKTAKVCKK